MRSELILSVRDFVRCADGERSYDFQNKRIGVIGSGSSAIQIIPRLQKVAGTQLSCFIRSRTWISPPFGQEMWDKLGLTSFISTTILHPRVT